MIEVELHNYKQASKQEVKKGSPCFWLYKYKGALYFAPCAFCQLEVSYKLLQRLSLNWCGVCGFLFAYIFIFLWAPSNSKWLALSSLFCFPSPPPLCFFAMLTRPPNITLFTATVNLGLPLTTTEMP